MAEDTLRRQPAWGHGKAWLAGWAALLVATASLYLLPFTHPAERAVLLLCQCLAWAGAIAVLWRHRFLRVATFALAAVELFPIRSGLTRAALLGLALLLWAGLAYTYRERRALVVALLAIPAVAGLFLLMPGRPVNAEALRQEYVRSLYPYLGAIYIWGGETRAGIDCSGLVRCGWIDANLRIGLRTANPGPVREAIRTWLHDCSAKELGEGYHGRTTPLMDRVTLNQVDYRRVESGDVAVSESGLHTLAYVGNRTWIEADPTLGGVAVIKSPSKTSVWFDTPMRIVRWSSLCTDGPPGPRLAFGPTGPR